MTFLLDFIAPPHMIGRGVRSNGARRKFSYQACDPRYMKKGFRTKGYKPGLVKGFQEVRPRGQV